MASERSEAGGGGIGIMGVLFIVFLVLKLVGVIDWSWWWVTSPLWGPLALLAALFVVVVLCGWFGDQTRRR